MGTLFFVILAVAGLVSIIRNLGRDDEYPSQPFGNNHYNQHENYPVEGNLPPQIHIHNSAYPMGGGYGGYPQYPYYQRRHGSGWATLLILVAGGAGLLFFLSRPGSLENAKKVKGTEPAEVTTPASPEHSTNPELERIFKPRQSNNEDVLQTSLNSTSYTPRHWAVAIGKYPSEDAANAAAQQVATVAQTGLPMFLEISNHQVLLRMDCASGAQAESVRLLLRDQRKQLEAFCPDPPEVMNW